MPRYTCAEKFVVSSEEELDTLLLPSHTGHFAVLSREVRENARLIFDRFLRQLRKLEITTSKWNDRHVTEHLPDGARWRELAVNACLLNAYHVTEVVLKLRLPELQRFSFRNLFWGSSHDLLAFFSTNRSIRHVSLKGLELGLRESRKPVCLRRKKMLSMLFKLRNWLALESFELDNVKHFGWEITSGNAAKDSLYSMLEDYVCHRGPFPFQLALFTHFRCETHPSWSGKEYESFVLEYCQDESMHEESCRR